MKSKAALPDPTDLIPRTENQAILIALLENQPLIMALGPAGTGKTYLAVAHAVNLLCVGLVERIVVTRPMVPAEEDPGALPGDINDKFAPYFAPVVAILDQLLGKKLVRQLVGEGVIEIAPLAFLRGHTFSKCVVILDEAQNTTPRQMKLFLSRVGEKCQLLLTGDLDQKDIPGQSGLEDAVDRLAGLRELGLVEFTEDDIVRSALCKKIMKRYK